VTAYVIKDGKANEIHLFTLPMTDNERQIVLDGCLINYNKFGHANG
jgi:aconitate hydratase